MKLKSLFILLFFTLISISCSEDDDSSTASNEFQGKWVGTFSGDDSGTWQATIDKKGEVEGEFTSNSFADFPIPLNGNVGVNGEINATYQSQFLQGEFSGSLEGNSGAGIWTGTSEDISGDWIGEKK